MVGCPSLLSFFSTSLFLLLLLMISLFSPPFALCLLGASCAPPSLRPPHYYKNIDLFRLGNPCCPGFPTGNATECPLVPSLATGKKEDLLSRLVTPTGTKGAASVHMAGAPFCPGWCYQPGQNVPFFSCFPFLNSFSISIIFLYFN